TLPAGIVVELGFVMVEIPHDPELDAIHAAIKVWHRAWPSSMVPISQAWPRGVLGCRGRRNVAGRSRTADPALAPARRGRWPAACGARLGHGSAGIRSGGGVGIHEVWRRRVQ